MTGCLVLTVSAGHLGGREDPGRLVAQALLTQGFPVASRQVVDEEESAVEAALRWGVEAHGLVVILSGAGGSSGEVVRRILSRVTGSRLILNDRLLAALKEFHAGRDRPMPRRADRLALLPQGAVVWTAQDGEPGWCLETPAGGVAVLPLSLPSLDVLIDKGLLPFARERFGGKGVTRLRTLRCIGIDPVTVEERLGEWIGGGGEVGVSCLPVEGEVWVRLRARGVSLPMVESAMREVETAVTAALGDDCYGGDQETLESAAGRLLSDRQLTLSVAESCTGGLLGHRITNVPGSSAYFERGVVVYGNRAKEELLGVPRQTLATHGAVSRPVAETMARGICRASGSSFGLAITGIAGPDGGTRAKPVGTVFIALATPTGVEAHRFRFTGGRESIKWQSTQMALDLLRRHLLKA
jgi:nicotinamide-nucleotide amidase